MVTLNRATGAVSTGNLGDSGFYHVRNGVVVKKSEEQTHGFNFPYQLSIPSQQALDHPDAGTLDVKPGDLIILTSDGFIDNVFVEEMQSVLAKVDTADPAAVAKALTAQAHAYSLQKNRRSPFGANARLYGYHYQGGKQDDITVVVAVVVSDD